ncbi:arsenate reductase ArsC [Endozoicomonas sp. Mp262]|uniref:arsenate reductase ArsC n=1 Tax=Endozoicomonas sp. Mp262 TaxID=2919499 RepID=UPI0021E00A60
MKLLFLCTHNACRSILAEAITYRLAEGQLTVASAGSAPTGKVHPLTLEQLETRGYNTQSLTSKSWDDLKDYHPDIVITVCDQAAGESCPIWLGPLLKLHWGLPDPTHLDNPELTVDAAFDLVISTIEARVKALLSLDTTKSIDALKAELQALQNI